MGYPTKVQLIQRKGSEQWYINFPAVLAAAMEFNKGEVVEWIVQDRTTLTLRRREAQKAKRRTGSRLAPASRRRERNRGASVMSTAI